MILKNSIYIAIICYITSVLFYSFDPLMQSIPSVLTTQLMQQFSISSVGIGFIASSYFYSYNLMQIPAGVLCDKYGIRKMIFIFTMICMVGVALFAFSNSLTLAITARILMGLGASCAASIVVLVSREYFSIKYLPILIGFAQLMGNVGSISGQVPLAMMTSIYGWHISIALLLIIPLFIMGSSLAFKKSSMRDEKKFSQMVNECHTKLRVVLNNRTNWLIALYAMLLWTPFYVFSSLWGIPFLQQELGIPMTHASEIVSVSWIGSGIGSLLIGVWSSYVGKRKICISISAISGLMIFPSGIPSFLKTPPNPLKKLN